MKKYFYELLIVVLLLPSCKDNTENKNSDNTESTITTKPSIDKNETLKNILLKAKPDSVTIDVSKTAVIVVDMTNDFGAKGGMFDRAGINISGIQEVIAPSAKVIAAARRAGITIIYLKMAYRPDLSDLGAEGAYFRMQSINFMHVGDTITAPDGFKSRVLIRDNWGTDIVPELKPDTNDIEIYKTRFSGFYQTNLDSTLIKLGKKYLIIIGCTTSVCVESTVRDAAFRDYYPVVLEDCTAEPIGADSSRTNKQASLLVIQDAPFGWVSNSKEFINAIVAQSNSNNKALQ